MSDAEWKDGDDPRLREIFGHVLRSHVSYQDGRYSEAPALVFSDCDYEVGDGSCGLSEDGKRCNEPAIIYTRADALVDALDSIRELEAERDAAYLAGVRAGLEMAAEQAAHGFHPRAIRDTPPEAIAKAVTQVKGEAG